MARRIDDQYLLAPTDLAVESGECLVLRGENGAGKSTLLRILAGLTTPSEGECSYDGRTVDERDPVIRAAFGAFVDPPGLYTDLTLRDHLALLRATWPQAPTADEAFALFGIEHLAARYPHELSSGQGQLFVLTLAFARPCEVLLLDEPEQRLDPVRRGRLAEAVLARTQAGGIVVLATHSPELADRVGDLELELEPA